MAPPKCAEKCRHTVTAYTMALDCEMCFSKGCIVCSNISEEEYKFHAKKGSGTHWFCKKCDEAAIDGLKMVQKLQGKTRCIEEKVDRLEIGVKKIETVQCPEMSRKKNKEHCPRRSS